MNYEARLRSKVSDLVPICETFHELCSNAEGIFPSAAFDLLKQLEIRPESAKIRKLIDSANCYGSVSPRWFADLENLIVDFDWRFQKDTAERLFGMVSRFGRVACVGSPTVFSLLSKVRRTDILIDQNPYYASAFGREGGRIFCSTIEDIIPSDLLGQFDAALLDPPWSLVDYESWLEATLPLVVKGGSLFIPIFPNLLRESAEFDVSSFMQRLAEIGPVSFLPFRVRYETPTFEEEVLKEKGLPTLHGWRSARMAEVHVEQSFRPTEKPRPAKEKWDRFAIGSTLVAVKSSRSANSQSSGGRFFFLDSVSSRDESRPLITAVSSRNIATDFQDTSLLSKTLQSIAVRAKITDDVDPLIVAARYLGASYG